MSDHKLRGRAAIVGTALSGMGEAPGRNPLEIAAAASVAALDQCGLTPADVDGLFTNNMANLFPGLSTAEYFGIKPKHMDTTNLGGSSFVNYVISAAMALEAGLCNVALICYGSNQRTAAGRLVSKAELPTWEAIYGARYPVVAYALAAARHMHEFGTTREQLAAVAVAARQWAQKNPDAFERGPLSIDDVLSSRMLCDPLSVRDCCLVTDGGGAVVMVRADRARDMPVKPAYFLGGAAANWNRGISYMPDLTQSAAAESGPRAFAMAGLQPRDVDVLALYDAFTINTILFLEDLGFCKKGEGGSFVEGGRIAPGGELPVNTNGGGLSCVHPGMYGIFTLIEGATQLQNAAGERQVPDAKIALCHGNGGHLSSQVTVLLGTADAL